jgi:basic membrane protein A and related proteins
MPRFFACVVLGLALAASAGSRADAAKQYRVAFVADVGGVGAPIMQQNVAGLRRAFRDLDVEIRVVVQPVRTSWTSTFTQLARQRYDLVMAAHPIQTHAVLAAARAYPQQRFLVGDSRVDQTGAVPGPGVWPANVQGLTAREEEIGFVVGYLAGLVEHRRPGRDVVGSVGGWDTGSVNRFIAGYRAGARRASRRIRFLNTYAYNFSDPDPCERIAEGQIAKGAGVVFNVAGECGFGTLAAARKHGVWGIGVDQDQAGLGPHILTSAVKDVELMTYRTIELLAQDRLETGRDTTLGLREGVLRLGRVSPRIPPALVRQTRRIERAIASGRIADIPTTVGEG